MGWPAAELIVPCDSPDATSRTSTASASGAVGKVVAVGGRLVVVVDRNAMVVVVTAARFLASGVLPAELGLEPEPRPKASPAVSAKAAATISPATRDL